MGKFQVGDSEWTGIFADIPCKPEKKEQKETSRERGVGGGNRKRGSKRCEAERVAAQWKVDVTRERVRRVEN